MVEFGIPSLMAVIFNNKKLLVLKFSDFYNHSGVNKKYVLPGGRPNKGETLTNVLIREVSEEIRLNIKVLDLVHLDLFAHKPHGKIRPIAFFNCKATIDKEIKLSEEHEDYKWVTLEEAKSLDWIDECFLRFLDNLVID